MANNILEEEIVECCKKCALYHNMLYQSGTGAWVNSVCMMGKGNPDADIMIIGPCPKKNDIEDNKHFGGEGGDTLDNCLHEIGLQREDVYITYVVKCLPPIVKVGKKEKDTEPKAKHVKACKEYLDEEIKSVNPNVIITIGKLAAETIVKSIKKRGKTITTIHGTPYPYKLADRTITCIPTFNPNYVNRITTKNQRLVEFIQDFQKAKTLSSTKEYITEEQKPTRYEIIDTIEKVNGLFTGLNKQTKVVIDIETTGLSPKDHKMTCIAFSCHSQTGITLPIREWYFEDVNDILDVKYDYWDGNVLYDPILIPGVKEKGSKKPQDKIIGTRIWRLKNYWNNEDLKIILEKLNSFLINEQISKIGHNIAFDVNFLNYELGIECKNIGYDTMIAEYLMDQESKESKKLEDIAYSVGMGGYADGLKDKRGTGFRTESAERIYFYACGDVDCTYRKFEQQTTKKINGEFAMKPYMSLLQKLMIPLSVTLRYMEINGVKVDVPYIKQLTNEYEKNIKQSEFELRNLDSIKEHLDRIEQEERNNLNTKRENSKILNKRYTEEEYLEKNFVGFSFNSPAQLRELLFDYLKIKCPKKTKTGLRSTDEEVLLSLKANDVVKYLLDLRKLWKIYGTYLKPIPDMIDSEDRLHTSYSAVRTATGRLASSRPNLQNIPKKERGKEIRKYFIASDNHVLLEGDYKQVEYRILAHFVNNPKQLQDIADDFDIHRELAAKIYKVTPEEVTDDQRTNSKKATFGIPYGIAPESIAESFNMPIQEAIEFRQAFFDQYKEIEPWINNEIELARKLGYVTTFFGRKRTLPLLNDTSSYVRESEERKVVATIIQSTASDLLSLATIRLHKKLKEINSKTKMVLTVHDALILEVPIIEKDNIIRTFKEVMEVPIPGIRAKIDAELSVGTKWGEFDKL